MKRVTVVGLGLMGASLAGALKKGGMVEVTGIDTDPDAVGHALENGWIDRGAAAYDPKADAADVLFLCLYPEAVLEFLKRHGAAVAPGTLVTDIAGIQKPLSEAAVWEIHGLSRIGGHPLCGKEGRGHEQADPLIFKGAPYILIDGGEALAEKRALLERLLRSAGVGPIGVMTADEHDRHVAVVSHLPHLISSAFLTALEPRTDLDFHGGSFRDLSRIAEINPGLWTQIVKNNKMYLMEALNRFMDRMDDLRTLIEADAYEAVQGVFEQTKERKKSLG